MRALGFDVKKNEVLQLMREYDRDEKGRLEYPDFVEISNFLFYFVDKFFIVLIWSDQKI